MDHGPLAPTAPAWIPFAAIRADLRDSGAFFTVEVAPGGSAVVRLVFDGEPNVPGQDAAWTLMEGQVAGGIIVGRMAHDSPIDGKGIIAEEGGVALAQLDAPVAGRHEVGPPSPDPILPLVGSAFAPRINWEFALREGHHHFVIRAVHAIAAVTTNVTALQGEGVRLTEIRDGTELLQARKHPNPDDWDIDAQLQVAKRGTTLLHTAVEVLYPRNHHVLGAPGPGSILTVGNCGGPLGGGIGATQALFHWDLTPQTYDVTARITPATVGNPGALSILIQFPDHPALEPHPC